MLWYCGAENSLYRKGVVIFLFCMRIDFLYEFFWLFIKYLYVKRILFFRIVFFRLLIFFFISKGY